MGICGFTDNSSSRSLRALETETQYKLVWQDVPNLPSGWDAWLDQRTGKVHYQNNVYKTTQWVKPLKEVPAKCRQQLPIGWTAEIDRRTGQVYYQNHKESSTQWKKPEPVTMDTGSHVLDIGSHEFSKSEEKFIGLFTKARQQSSIFEFGECSVCFEELFENRPTVLTDERRRVCRHFICNDCAKALIEDRDFHCPLCRAAFSSIKILPDIRENPKEWFDVCDQDGTGRLTRQELTDALTVILPIKQTRIEKDLDILWNKWDHDNTTKINWDRAAETVIPYVKRKLYLPQFQQGVIPDLRSVEEQSKWFDYWDIDSNGILDKQELARGLIKTFEQYMTQKRVRKLVKKLLEELWGVLVGEDKESISVKDFTMEDGFGATVRVTLEEVSRQNEKLEDSSSSVVIVPALCPPLEGTGEDISFYVGHLDSQHEENERKDDGDFYGYFTASIAEPKLLIMDEKKRQEWK